MEEMINKEPPLPGTFTALKRVVLASASPRRRELLALLGVSFDIIVAEGAEPEPGEQPPEIYAMLAAEAKAAAVVNGLPACGRGRLPVVIGADTIVVLPDAAGPCILGKPKNDAEALAMLLHLAGKTHQVCTGCCIVWPPDEPLPGSESGPASGHWRYECFYDIAEVTFAPWPEPVLAAYVRTGEGRDKAGSYAVQGCGAFLAERISGQWSTIVGLPVQLLAQRLLRGGGIGPR